MTTKRKKTEEFMARKKVRFVRHATCEETFAKLTQLTLMDAKVPKAEWGDWEDSNDEMIPVARANGYWGFSDEKRQEVHYWAKKSLPSWRLAFLLGHEVGHLSGISVKAKKRGQSAMFKAFIAEEDRADSYGAACDAVFRYMKSIKRI